MPEGSKNIVLGGLFCWHRAFNTHGQKGALSANLTRELMEEFDIIHVNYTPGNASYLSAVRDALGDHSSTKLITQPDFSVGLWNSMDPYIMRDQLKKADFVFAVEPMAAKRLNHFLDMDVPVIPHPIDVSSIKRYRTQPKMPPTIAMQYHRYMYSWATYFYGTYRLRRDPEFAIRTALMNVNDQIPNVALDGCFDEVVDRGPYEVFLQMLSDCLINIDLPPDYTYGRGIVEAAALGVPTIGSHTVRAQNIIWPELSIPPYDEVELDRKLEALLTDGEFASQMATQGMQRAEIYNLENSYNLMVKHLEERDLI